MIILDTSFLIDFFKGEEGTQAIIRTDVATVLIAGIAIANGAEKVATRDGDFMEISKVAELEVQVY